jgi:hypothetical protein
MSERAVKEGYEGRRFTKEGDHSTGNFIFWGALLDLQRGELSSVVGRISTGGTGLLGVLGTGARISIWYPGAR